MILYIYLSISAYFYVCMYLSIYQRLFTSIYVRKDVCMNACMYACMYIYPTPPLGQDMTQGQFLSGV